MPPKAAAKPKKKAGGYQLPEKFDEGFVLRDVFKTNWTLGRPIGQGGFGLIYLAKKGETDGKKSEDAQFVVKIEPKDNGPLFCETHFYANTAKEEQIKTFMRTRGLGHLGMPRYISTGLCTYKEKEYRFLVMDRYTRDLQSFLDEDARHQINEVGVLCLMRQILHTLEYIHSHGYAHGDIKGANVMLKTDAFAYLVDYGLVVRFERDGQVQKYQIKPERRHNGTIEYTSRDAHDGAQINRRSDMEILGYCAVHWLSGHLPWIDLISNNDKVQQSKVKYMSNVKEFISVSFKDVTNVSDCTKSFIEFYLNEVNKLNYESEPAYAKVQAKLNETLASLGHSSSKPDFFGLFDKKVSTKKSASSGASKAAVAAAAKNHVDDIAEVKKPAAAVKSSSAGKPTAAMLAVAASVATNGSASRGKKTSRQNQEDDYELGEKEKENDGGYLGTSSGTTRAGQMKSRDDSIIIEDSPPPPSYPSSSNLIRSPRDLYSDEIRGYNKTPLTKSSAHLTNATNTNASAKKNPDVGRLVEPPKCPISPLSLAATTSEPKYILVKRKRNVQTATASTQTDPSLFYY